MGGWRKFGAILAILVGILELESFLFILHGFGLSAFWRVFLPLGAHLLAVSLLAFGFVRSWDYSDGRDRAWVVVALCMTLPLPLIGYLGYVLIFSMHAYRVRGQGELLKDFQEYITFDPSVAREGVQQLKTEKFVMEEVDVSPLKDILAGKDVDLKRGAILSLSRLPRREAVDLLKKALSDESREIRYYASTALSDMEKDFNDRIFRLVREVERNPAKVVRHVELAKIILEYIDAGLLDEGMNRYFNEIGLRALDKAGLVPNPPPEVNLYTGLLHREARRFKKAEESLFEYVEQRPDDAAVMLVLAEIALEQGDVGGCRERVLMTRRRFPDDVRFQDLARLVGVRDPDGADGVGEDS